MTDPTPPDAPLRDQLATQRTDFARARTALANERTLLAYARTALALLAGGLALLQLVDAGWATAVGLASLPLSAVVLGVGIGRFRAVRRQIAG